MLYHIHMCQFTCRCLGGQNLESNCEVMDGSIQLPVSEG